MPGAQPADLGGPPLSSIFGPPNAGAGQQLLAQYLSGQQGPTTMPGVQGSAPPAQGPMPQPTPTPQPNAPTPAPAPSLDSFQGAFGGQGQAQGDPLDQFQGAFGTPPTTPRRGDQFTEGPELTLAQLASTPGASISDFWERLKASMGRNPTEVASVLQSTYGADNVRIRGDRVYFRKPGETSFRALDPKQFSFFGDLIADMGGNMAEAAAAVPAEYAGQGGAKLALQGGGPLGVPVAGASLAAGFGMGAWNGQQVRKDLLLAAGGQVDPNANEMQEYTKSLGTNVATAGIGKVVGGVLGKISTALENSPIARVRSIAEIQGAIEDMANAYRVGGSQASPEETGAAVKTVVQRARQRMNGFVEAARQLVGSTAGDTKFPVSNTLSSLKQVLQQQGVAFDKDGVAKIAGNLADEQFPITREVQRQSPILGADAKPIITQELRPDVVTVPGAPVQAPVSPLGTETGQSELQKMVDMYNQFNLAQKNGGVDAEALFRTASDTGERSSYNSNPAPGVSPMAADKISSRWRAVNAGAIADRDQAAIWTLPPDSPEFAAYKSAMQHYTDSVDGVKRFESLISRADKQGSLPTLADGIIQPNKPEVVRQFKNIVGDSATQDLNPGQTWDTVRGSWLSSLINSPAVRDPTTGLISGKSLMKTLNGYGPDVLKQVFDGGELGDFRKLATKLDSIYKGDLNPAKAADTIAAAPIWTTMFSAKNIANAMWGMTSQNAELADRLLDDGFMKMYRDAAPQNRAKIIGAMNQYQQMYDQSIKTKLANGWTALKLPSTYMRYFGLTVPSQAVTQGIARGAVRQGTAAAVKGTGATLNDVMGQLKGLKSDVQQDYLGYGQPASPPAQ